ncbi:MAG: OmpA family protein [Prolixibacteraceae bacterium]
MKAFKVLLALFMLMAASGVYAQLNVKDKIKEKSANRTETRVDEGIDKGIDKIEEGVGKLFKKKKTNSEENTEEEQTSTDEEADERAETSEPDNDQAAKTSSSLQSFTKYDFVPGDQILYFEDFSQDAIGDFPALWTTNGGGEVKTLNIASGNWFHMNKEDAVYCYTKPISFPENFIMEFDMIPDGDFSNGYTLTFYEDPENTELTDDLYPGKKGLHISFEEGRWYTKGYNNSMDVGGWIEGESATNPVVVGQVNHVIIWVQNRRLRIYHKGAKVFDMPTNVHAGSKFNRFRFSGWSTYSTPYVTNLKITTAAPDTRSKLITEGKLVSYGIYFDVNKDVVKAESYGTLSDIAKTLKENPTVRIKIVGHTDGDGADVANLDLSKRRGDSVKNELVKTFGIDASRIESDGLGETKPIAPNDTPANKALNRRVEFIKI